MIEVGLETARSVAAVAALVGLVLVVHELGHYVVAGMAGIPAADRRLVFTSFPPHLALPEDGEWVSPFEPERFSSAYGRYDPERRFAVPFTAGGFLGQVALVPPALALEHVAGLPVGTAVVTTSLWFAVGYLGYDLLVAARKRAPHGDTTHLWRLSPRDAVLTHVALFGSHGAALLVLAG